MQVNVNAAVLALGIAIGATCAMSFAPQPARAAGPEFEYHIETLSLINEDGSMNAKAGEGWEVMSIHLNAANFTTALMRRPKVR